jgi:hypothetical protein
MFAARTPSIRVSNLISCTKKEQEKGGSKDQNNGQWAARYSPLNVLAGIG